MPARQQFLREQRIVTQPAIRQLVQAGKHQRDREHDEKRELKTGFEQLARFADQNDESGEGEGI